MSMAAVFLLTAVILPMVLAAVFLLLIHRRRVAAREELSPVTRQHIDLFQGGHVNEKLLEAAKERYRQLLESGDMSAIEASLRPGTHFVVQVQALAEIGTDEAGRILERQLQRRLTHDTLEQSWYWIDLARSLRILHRQESLPYLLRCAEQAGDNPLRHFLAAETVCFLGFSGYLRRLDTPLGRAALRTLHRALEGLRYGVAPHLVAEARLGEVVERLWDERSERALPQLTGIAVEVVRLLRRQDHLRGAFGLDDSEQESFNWQLSHLAALEPALTTYLGEAPLRLTARLPAASAKEQLEILAALGELRAEVGVELIKLISRGLASPGPAFAVLAWSRDAKVGRWLRDWICGRVPMLRRAQKRKRALPPRRPSLPADAAYAEALTALRGHAAAETEACLILAAKDWDPTFRAAALGSFGWWEPINREAVINSLNESRKDMSIEVRKAARAALARLGERQALQWFRQALASENAQQVYETVHDIAREGLTLLWPELDRLADADDPDLAHAVHEALERLSEDMERRS